MRQSLFCIAALAAGLCLSPAVSVSQVQRTAVGSIVADDAWLSLDSMPPAIEAGEPWIRAKASAPFAMDRAAIEKLLSTVPSEDSGLPPVVITIPMPDGTLARFAAVQTPVMHPQLQAQYPNIRTYSARGIDDVYAVARLDLTPAGFHAMIWSPADGRTGGTVLVDPYTRGNDEFYSSYYARDYDRSAPFVCHTIDDVQPQPFGHRGAQERIGADRRTYRLAVSTTGEFTAFHGGTVAGGLAAVVTMVNRITGVYEQDLNVRLQLVANNNLVIYTNAATDPYGSPSSAGTSNTDLQTALNSVIGSSNYDVGHVLHRGSNNGLAGGIGTVCGSTKAQGYTSVDPPTGDLLAIDYAAHELGHQFGGRHTFNNCGGGAGDSSTIAVEPGSGTTIMGYAGICGTNNAQLFSDPYFSAINIFGKVGASPATQMFDYISTGGGSTCPVVTPTGNSFPTVEAGPNYTIPRQTAFALTAATGDADSDPVTHSWETMDASSTAVSLPVTDATSNPLYRAFPPVASPTRTFPRLEDVIDGSVLPTEVYPTQSRSMSFRCVARDGRGGVAADDMTVTVLASAGPFVVTAPNGGGTFQGPLQVTWNPAGTNGGVINCQNVRILLSVDGGFTTPYVLNASTPNDGSETVLLPAVVSDTARIRIEAVGNIFFDLSNANFAVRPQPAGVFLTGTGARTITDTTGNGNGNGIAEPGETSIRISATATNFGLTTATNVTGTLISLTPGVTVVQGVSSYANLATSATATNDTAFVVRLDPSVVCGSTMSLRLSLDSSQGGGNSYDYTIPVGVPGGTGAAQVYSYTGPAVAVPDANATGVTINLPISTSITSILDCDFSFDGTACSVVPTSTTVGFNHSFVGDLVIDLIGPDGTTVRLSDRRGGTGENFCQTFFDDAAASPISGITASGAPFTASFRPEAALSAFNGKNANGTWKLKVVDAANVDTGSVRFFSIRLKGANPPVCQPPLANACPADFNDDGFVDDTDFTIFAAAYEQFTVPPADVRADLNNDGFVDDTDFTIFAAAYEVFVCP